jgi:PAS domain S-box-containing protein
MTGEPTYDQPQQEVKEPKKQTAQLEQVKDALLDSDEWYRDLIEKLNDVVYVADQNGIITYISPVIKSVSGYAPWQIIGRSFTEFIYREDLPRVMTLFQKAIAGDIQPSEYRIVTRSGEIRWVRTSSRVCVVGGKAIGLRGVLTDVTERMRAEEALRAARDELETIVKERTAQLLRLNDELRSEIARRKEVEEALLASEKRFKELWDDAPVAYHVVDTKGIIIGVNRTETAMLGYSREEMIGKSIFDFVLPGQRKEARRRFGLKLRGQHLPKNDNRVYVRKDGAWVHVSIDDVLERTDKGQATGVRTTMVDISKRKKAEKALEERRQELKAHTRSLEDMNVALKVLLKHRADDRSQLEQKVVSNVTDLVLPYFETLRNTRLDTRQKGYLSIIESNLNDIISPFLQKLSSKYLRLTPKEIQVADLIRQGKTTKEIAELFNMSTRAVRFHRENVRAKLGLKNKPGNLRTYLNSLSHDASA